MERIRNRVLLKGPAAPRPWLPILLLLTGVLPLTAQAQTLQWVRQFGSPGADGALAISTHSSGVYVAGHTDSTLPGQTSVGGPDVFVRKYDFDGKELWTRQFGTAGIDFLYAISAHDSGIYVAGATFGTFPGQSTAGLSDAFVRKYDFDGNELWTRQFGSPSFDLASGVSVDATGVYVAGITTSTLPGQTGPGGTDAFLRKYDVNGNELWTRQFGSPVVDHAYAVSAHPSGAYVAGLTNGTLPGQTSAGGFDAFVRKYDSSGNELWTRQFGTAALDEALGISAVASGVYVAGFTAAALPGQTSAGGFDAIVRKYDFTGNQLWSRQFGTAGNEVGLAISADASGASVAGYTSSAFPGQNHAGDLDAFVRRYGSSGNELWTRQLGSPGSDAAQGVSAHSSGIYAGGQAGGILPGQTGAGGFDAFAIKFSVQTPLELIQQLIEDVLALNLRKGMSNSLIAKLNQAARALSDMQPNNDSVAIGALQRFVGEVEAQRGAGISSADADALIELARQIIAMLGG